MTTWNPVWDKIFHSREWGKYPIEEVIRFVAKNYYPQPERKKIRFLDLGSGVGSVSWYLCREGFNVTATDGSSNALRILSGRLKNENYSADLVQSDVSALPFPDKSFDCVIDANCLMCNRYDDTIKILDEIWRILKNDGKLFSYTPMSNSWGDGIGLSFGRNTYSDAEDGPFSGMGIVRFSTHDDLLELYRKFSPITCDFHHRSVDNQKHVISFWAVTGTKK